MNITITAQGTVSGPLGDININSSDSQTAQLGGTQPFTLTASFDPGTQQGTVTGLDFYNGNIQVLNTLNWDLNLGNAYGFYPLGDVYVIGANILAEVNTLNPPTSVSSGAFPLANQELILNGGTLSLWATGNAAGDISPSTNNLAATPIEGPLAGSGNGTVTLSSPTVAGNTASYTVTVTLPVNFSYLYMTSPVDVTVTITGTTIWQGTLTVTTASYPSVPTGLTATPSTTQIVLHWSASSGSPTGYNVLRSTTSGAETFLASVGSSSTSYTDSSVTAGTTYYYVVSAANSSGNLGGNSAEASASLVVVPPPSRPTILPVYLDATYTNLVLRVATQTGYNYLLESTTSLTPPQVWSTNSTAAGPGEPSPTRWP